MLQVFYGKDILALRAKARAVFIPFLGEGELLTLEDSAYQLGSLSGLSQTSSLFQKQSVYLLDFPDTSEGLFLELLETAEALASSSNLFIVLVESLTADEKKMLKPYASVLEESKKTAAVKFNPFSLADALSYKDKKNLWFLLQEAKRNKLSAEEIVGTLWWQLKTLRLATLTKSAEEAGMKDYPYQKAKNSLKNFKPSELQSLSEKLIKIYHRGHRGEVDLELSLEAWVLAL